MAKFSLNSKLPAAEREQLLVDFFRSLAAIKNSSEAAKVLCDLLSPNELDMVAKRLAIARALLDGENYQAISRTLRVSTNTIARVNAWLNESGEGYRLVVGRVSKSASPKARDHIWASTTGLAQLKRQYPQYFWPELLLKRIIATANKRERLALLSIVSKTKHKTKLLKQIDRILKNPVVK